MSNKQGWLSLYLDYTRHLEAPLPMHFWSGVSAMAAVLQRRCYVNMGQFKWFPNFFIVLVGEPGIVAKSTTLGVGYELIRAAEFEPGTVYTGPSSCTWQALVDLMSKSLVEYIEPDSKTESHSASLSVAISELGTFFDLSDSKMVDHLVDLWDCGYQFIKLTKGAGEEVLNYPFLNIIAGTTPSWIRSNLPRYMIGGGFTSRTIFCLAKGKRHLTAYPQRKQPEPLRLEQRLKLIEGLHRMAALQGEVALTEAAYEFGEAWYHEHFTNPSPRLRNELMKPYAARKQCHMHKIAMIRAISDNIYTSTKPPKIDVEHLQFALKILDDQEETFLEAVSMMGETAGLQATTEIAAYVQSRKVVSHSDLMAHFGTMYTYKQIEEALKVGQQARHFIALWSKQDQQNIYKHFPK